MKHFSIRSKLMISIIFGCLIPFVLASLFIQFQSERWSNSYALDKSQLLLQQTAQRVDESVIKNMEQLVNLIVNDTNVQAVDRSVDNFVEYNGGQITHSDSQIQKNIEYFFKQISESYDIINLVSIGTVDGGYIEYPQFNPKNAYDPRVRPWYTSAVASDGTVISEPYVTKESKELVISIDKKVEKNGQMLGVVSLTFRLDDLMQTINAIPIGRTGYIYVLSPSNTFVSCPLHTDWLMQSVESIDTDVFKQVDQYNNKSYEAVLAGTTKVISVYTSSYSGWKYVLVTDKSEIYEQSQKLSKILFIITIIIIIGVFITGVIISIRISKPILNIANRISKMSTFNFESYEESQDYKFVDHNDEIGIISRALKNMHQSFLELRDFMREIDYEIDQIEVSNKAIKEMELSPNSPFKTMEKSLNGLLKKIYDAFNQVHVVNQEIMIKNEQLISSEEQLTVQVEEIEQQREYITYLADHDPLTNLPNRRKFNATLETELEEDVHGAILLLDLDNFKTINDTLGHLFGDKVLKIISEKLLELQNQNIFISRFGGDEFLMLFKNYKTKENLNGFIQSIYEAFANTIVIDNYEVKLEFSIGISLFPDDSKDIDQLIMNADLALYSAKNSGKRNFSYYDSQLGDSLMRKLRIKNILIEAIENDGFKMLYQPQVDIMSGEIIGYEALVRLKDHNIPAGEFIEVAEEYGQIIAIGRIVTRKVVEQQSLWRERGLNIKPVAINYSAHQIMDLSYKEFLFELLEDKKIAAENICIEITESIFLENQKATIEFLNQLRAKGIKIAVDDFGTGYSSLSYLTFLPIDTLKLDRQLCLKFLEFENVKVMDSLIALAHSLKFKVIAEGIEEVDQVKRLIVGRCDAIQGYYYSKPLEADAIMMQNDSRYAIFQDNIGSKFAF